ncbi:MAG: hypothetical protein SFY69_04560 [Planctomycetota bacterium]|nr:hypothetical protein [Planctomycetota bacterium]
MCAVVSLYLFLVLMACVGTRTDEPRSEMIASCRRCKYDLQGLPDNAACPECGVPDPRTLFHASRTFLVLTWSRQPRLLLLSVGVMVAYTAYGEAFIVELLADSYMRMGFLESTARNAVRVRDLRGGAPSVLAALPLTAAVVLFPCTAMIRDAVTAWRIALTALALGIVLTVYLPWGVTQ